MPRGQPTGVERRLLSEADAQIFAWGGGFVPDSVIPQLLIERSIRHERMSDVGERAMALKCRIVGRRDGRAGRLPPKINHPLRALAKLPSIL